MNYFYRTSLNQLVGPLPLADICAMVESGQLSASVMVAREGDTAWRPLPEVAAEQGLALTLEGIPGPCPKCGKPLTMKVPTALNRMCPACGRLLRPPVGRENNLWYNFTFALHQYASFNGRSTRQEFWSFVLFSNLIYVVVSLVGMLVCIGITGATGGDALANILSGEVMNLVNMLLTLFFWLPSMAVMVRRLHDVGWSGKWMVANVCAGVLFVYSVISMASMPESMGVALFVLASFGLLACLWMLMFILALMDSQRGPNKYGPSRKYPLG